MSEATDLPRKSGEASAFNVLTKNIEHARRKLCFALRLQIGMVALVTLFACKSQSNSPTQPPLPDLTKTPREVAQRIDSLRLEIDKTPDSAEAWGNLAMALDVHDFKAEAVPFYRRAFELDPTEFRWNYFCAIVLSELGSAEALLWFERSAALKPDYAPLFVISGQWFFDNGYEDKAENAFRKAVDLDQTIPQAYIGSAKIALANDLLDESLENLLHAVRLDDQNREAHGILAQVYRRLGDPQKAIEETKIAQQLPKISPLRDPVYEELVKRGISAFWYRERGLVYQANGQLDDAIREFEIALRIKPDSEGHNYVGNLLRKQGRFEEAARQYEAAIGLNPTYYVACNNLSQTLFEIGRVDDAIKWAETTLRINPGFALGYMNLGSYHLLTGRSREAVAVYRRGLAATRHFSPLAMRLAWLLAASPDPTIRNGKEALLMAKSIVDDTELRDAETLDLLAVAYAETGQFNKAIQMSRQALQLSTQAQSKDLAEGIAHRLRLFESNKPYREKQLEHAKMRDIKRSDPSYR
ncbi:tetratricopeptide repeat protein [bacterium]|nr:tetratricopeptide repeat protein [bacterium]